jgi:hypothetical protein
MARVQSAPMHIALVIIPVLPLQHGRLFAQMSGAPLDCAAVAA